MFTFWCFSTENWNRPTDEVAYLMDLFEEAVTDFGKWVKIMLVYRLLDKNGVFALHSKKMTEVENITATNTGTIINIGMSYGGRDEIVQGIKKYYARALNYKISPKNCF